MEPLANKCLLLQLHCLLFDFNGNVNRECVFAFIETKRKGGGGDGDEEREGALL